RPPGAGRSATGRGGRLRDPPRQLRHAAGGGGEGSGADASRPGQPGRAREVGVVDWTFVLVAALAVFLVVFIKTEFGLYLVIFSMLLSPQLGSGGGGLAEGRRIVIRSEDILLLVVAFSWLAKTAVNKELGLAVKTRLN